jgi:hypothetical protein
MLYFKKEAIPSYEFQLAIKKPIPVKCIQINEPFKVETMEGVLDAKAGDYLMVGIHGEMYPCDNKIFHETYEILQDE